MLTGTVERRHYKGTMLFHVVEAVEEVVEVVEEVEDVVTVLGLVLAQRLIQVAAWTTS